MLLLGAGVAATGVGLYCAYRYSSVVAEGKQKKKQEQAADRAKVEAEEHAQAQMRDHFESIQKISDTTTLPSVLPHLKERLFELLDLSSRTEKLMSAKGRDGDADGAGGAPLSGKEKMAIWEELKVLSFSRTLCAMWAVCLLDLFVRIQLNVLGRHVYIETARNAGADPSKEPGPASLTMSCQHKFIAFADYLPHRGLDPLIADAQDVADEIVRKRVLKDPYTLEDLRGLIQSMRQAFEARCAEWLPYVLPDDNVLPEDLAAASSAADSSAAASPHGGSSGGGGGGGGGSEDDFSSLDNDSVMLEQLMLETRAVISSREFSNVLSAALDAVTDGVVEELRESYGEHPEAGVPLAKLLPPVAAVGASLLSQPGENRYIEALSRLPEVERFCEQIYTASEGARP